MLFLPFGRSKTPPSTAASEPGGSVANRPANPALFVYSNESSGTPSAWAHPGAMVIAGRSNYGHSSFQTVAAGGGTVLVYLDPIVNNTTGFYHQKLYNSSEFGAAVPNWPGNPVANGTGNLADFRVGSILLDKLPGVIDLMVSDNPHMAGLFLDDLGSRSWFPNFDFDSWSSTDKEAYRNGAIAICQVARAKADEHDLFLMANGTWSSASGTSGNGGYPVRGTNGNSLVDGGTVENHDPATEFGFWSDYVDLDTTQWGTATPRATSYMFFDHDDGNISQMNAWVAAGLAAFADYTDSSDGWVTPWGSFTDFGLPRRD